MTALNLFLAFQLGLAVGAAGAIFWLVRNEPDD